MKWCANSIRTVLLSAFAVLALLIAGLAGGDVYSEWQRLNKITQLKNATVISEKLFDATEKFSIERDIALTILHAPETLETLQPRLTESRMAADAAMNDAMGSLRQYRFPELDQLQQKTLSYRTEIEKLRQQISRTVSDRATSPTLEKKWYDTVTALTEQTEDLWLGFAGHFSDIDPTATLHMRYWHCLRIIMDNTGHERAAIAELISTNAAPTPQQSAELWHNRGAVDLSWKTAEILAAQSGLFPIISAEFSDAKSHYETLQDMTENIFYLPDAHSGTYPIGADIWLELSSELGDSLDDLKAASHKEIVRYVMNFRVKAQQAILFHGLILMIALTLCIYTFHLVTNRVVHPINYMIDALLSIANGKPGAFVPPQRRQLAEIGNLMQIMNALQRNVEAALLLAAVVESSEDAIISKTLDGKILSWNRGAEHLFDYSAAEAIGQYINLIIPPKYMNEENQIIAQIHEGKSVDHFETVRMAKGGRLIDISLAVSPIRNAAGEIIGASKTARDITERKQAEAQLLRYMRDLERSNQELDDFAYIASHDLKEPLRGLFNHASFLLEDYEGKLDEDGVKRLHRLAHLSRRMEHLVNDLLYFSRLGRAELAIQETNVHQIISDIEEMMESFLHERNAHIIVPKKLPKIVCDKPRITEVFRNLITNAVKYNDKPERIVEIGFLDRAETPQGPENGVFYVKDNGVGIEPGFHQEIFRIFKRLQPADGSKEEGTGVGLTFVKKIIERHKGRIWLESIPGQGTVFYFTLGR